MRTRAEERHKWKPMRAWSVPRTRGAPASRAVWCRTPTPTPTTTERMHAGSGAGDSGAEWAQVARSSNAAPDAGSRKQPRSADGPVPMEPSRRRSLHRPARPLEPFAGRMGQSARMTDREQFEFASGHWTAKASSLSRAIRAFRFNV
jgi:hypothetical protein